MDQNTFRHIVVMGVSGSGKTTVGEALSPLVGLEYRDGSAQGTAHRRAR